MILVSDDPERTAGRAPMSTPYAMRTLVATCLALAVLWIAGVASAGASRAQFPEFGFASTGVTYTETDGTPSRQAGAHPDITTRLTFNTVTEPDGHVLPPSDIRDVHVDLPPGVVGNPNAAPTCTVFEVTPPGSDHPECPVSSQIGVVRFYPTPDTSFGAATVTGLYNLEHGDDVPGAFAFNYAGTLVRITPRVRPGSYGISADSDVISEGQTVFGVEVTFWGIPADPSHDADRQDPSQGGAFGASSPDTRKAFMTSSTACTGEAAKLLISADSWGEPEHLVFSELTADPEGLPFVTNGCERLAFEPSMHVATLSRVAGTPTGLNVSIDVPQNESPDGLATSDVKSVSVNLPAGLSVSPSSANGLAACTSSEIALSSESVPTCPDQSKIGTVEINSDLLPEPLQGYVALAQPHDNPYDSLLAMYVVAKGPGVDLKIPGRITADPVTGQLNATFSPTPQLPFTTLRMKLNGGSHAPLVTPTQCGTYNTTYELEGWSGKTVTGSTPFTIDQGCGGGFSPAFTGGTTNNQAGGFSPLTVAFSRAQTDQAMRSISVSTPPGLVGVLKSVVQCPEPQASQGACGAASLIGHVAVGAGPDPDPFSIGGQVYLTGPYGGAPFGLAIVVPAVAGPFDLGTVVVRAKIMVDPHTAALTIVSDPFPTVLEGIPLDVRTITVKVDRSGFMFNPTSCSPKSLGATLSSEQGSTATLVSRFQASNCAALPFTPKFSVSTGAKSSRADGASLDAKVSSGPGQANIGKVAVLLPKQLPSRLTTIQKACPQETFAVNPALCPAGSLIGTGTAVTPILAHSLSGPAYLVSHGGAAFPDLVVVLQGEGVTVDLVGAINIHDAITSTTFANVPDVPVSNFELKLPTGPHSALAANGNFCDRKLVMPAEFTAQNGAELRQSTYIEVEGCPKSISIQSKSIEKKTLKISVYAPGTGKLKVSGKGVSSETKAYSGQEAQSFTLTQKKAGKLKTKIELSFAPSIGRKQSKTVAVEFKK
jgi:hypothetical protein